MDTISYTRRPDTLEAVQVTRENIHDVEIAFGLEKYEVGGRTIMVVRDSNNRVSEVLIGDWIARDVANKTCVISDDVMRAYYVQSFPV